MDVTLKWPSKKDPISAGPTHCQHWNIPTKTPIIALKNSLAQENQAIPIPHSANTALKCSWSLNYASSGIETMGGRPSKILVVSGTRVPDPFDHCTSSQYTSVGIPLRVPSYLISMKRGLLKMWYESSSPNIAS